MASTTLWLGVLTCDKEKGFADDFAIDGLPAFSLYGPPDLAALLAKFESKSVRISIESDIFPLRGERGKG